MSVATTGANPPRQATREGAPKQPLSSFLGRSTATKAPTDVHVEAEILRPGTTIASFQWPPVCRALTHQGGDQLDAVADALVAEARAGRSLIGLLGLFPNRGTSTLACCLAARLAGGGRRLILADANFRNPQLAAWLDATPTTPWQEVLKHRGSLADAVIRAKDDRFDLLALDSRSAPDALQLIGGLQAVVTAGILRHSYDLALFDLGAFFDAASQPIVLELMRNMGLDAVLAVTGPDPADPRDLDFLADQLRRSGCQPLGIIENRIVKPQAA
jgi:Mrp family chromosome partitioning ATPase